MLELASRVWREANDVWQTRLSREESSIRLCDSDWQVL